MALDGAVRACVGKYTVSHLKHSACKAFISLRHGRGVRNHLERFVYCRSSTMPCATGQSCKMLDNTPGPPSYTTHKCAKCSGFLHGICGVPNTEFDNELAKFLQSAEQTFTKLFDVIQDNSSNLPSAALD